MDGKKDVEFRKRQWEKLSRLRQYYEYGGSKLPPIALEPKALERSRVEGSGMTDQERLMRKQFLEDSALAHGEPRNVPDVRPHNVLRRAFAWPWDVMFSSLKPVLREPATSFLRATIPRALAFYIAFEFLYYQVKYHRKTWESSRGFAITRLSPPVDPYDHDGKSERPSTFFNFGFDNRHVLLDINKTSFTAPLSQVDCFDPKL